MTGDSMSDAAEGLVDADARIQERIDEREQQKKHRRAPAVKDPDRARRLESFRLAKTELERQLARPTHAVRRKQIEEAIAEIDRRIAEMPAV
jgi:hypothetical protein